MRLYWIIAILFLPTVALSCNVNLTHNCNFISHSMTVSSIALFLVIPTLFLMISTSYLTIDCNLTIMTFYILELQLVSQSHFISHFKLYITIICFFVFLTPGQKQASIDMGTKCPTQIVIINVNADSKCRYGYAKSVVWV